MSAARLLLCCCLAAVVGAAQGDRNVPVDMVFPAKAFAEQGGRFYDLTRAPFNAKGDGKTDNTAAFVAMMDFVRDRVRAARAKSGELGTTSLYMYLPNGTYLVSDSLVHSGDCPGGFAFLRLIGQDRRKTVIRLRDNAPGFGAGTRKPLLTWSKDPAKHQGNVAWGNELRNLTLDTGRGNPGAVGLVFLGANACAIDNLTIQSGDGLGAIGLWFPTWSVQGHFTDITIKGFDAGISCDHAAESNPALEHITLIGQREVGLRVVGSSPSVRDLLSANAVPAVSVEGRSAQLVLVDSELGRGDPGNAAIAIREAGSPVFLRNVQVSGYGQGVAGAVKAGLIAEWSSHALASSGAATPKRSMDLPVEDSPPPWWEPDLARWATPEDFAGDDRSRIQAALDSGKPAVAFPKKDYCADRPVGLRIPASVRQIDLMDAAVWAGFDIDQASDQPLWIDHPGGRMTFNLKARRTVIVRGGVTRWECTASEPTVAHLQALCLDGKLARFCPPQHRIYARSINNEVKDKPNFNIDGGLLWTLGFKTEGPAESFLVRHGGICEVLGGYRNQTMTDGGRPMLWNDGGNVSFIGYSSMIRTYEQAVWSGVGAELRKLAKGEFPARPYAQGNYYVPLFVHFDPAAVPAPPVHALAKAKPPPKERPAAPPPPQPVELPKAVDGAQAAWTQRLHRALAGALAAQRRIGFACSLPMLSGEATIDALDEDGDLVLLSGGMRLTAAWRKLKPAELASLSVAVAASGGTEESAIAAFFLRLTGGDEIQIARHLAAAKAGAAEVETAFVR